MTRTQGRLKKEKAILSRMGVKGREDNVDSQAQRLEAILNNE